MNRRFIGIDISAKYIEHARAKLYKAKQNEQVNFLVGKTTHENKKELEENWDFIKKQRNKKVNEEILEKHIKKNRDIRYGRNLKKKKEQSTFEF